MDLNAGPYRLLTRSDMDGLVCAVLLKELNLIDEIVFHHPKDVQDGIVAVGSRDILTNLPYVSGCAVCFDHHSSEEMRVGGLGKRDHVLRPGARSAAAVVYDYFGGRRRFPRVSQAMMAAVDKSDAAAFSREDVLEPRGWDLLSFIMDPRTGLGRFRDFRISNYQLMMMLIDCCRDMDIGEILDLPDVKERVDLYFEQHPLFRAQLERVARVHENLVVLDLRDEEVIHAGNRFVIYALYPQCDISMHVMWGRAKQNTVYAVGKSIFRRSSPVEVGDLMLAHGGGGHSAAGTCQGDNATADAMKRRLIGEILALSRRETAVA